MSKRTLSLLLALAMMLTLTGITVTTAAADDRPAISVAIMDRGQVPPEKGTYEQNDVTEWINEHSPVQVPMCPCPVGRPAQSTTSGWLPGKRRM